MCYVRDFTTLAQSSRRNSSPACRAAMLESNSRGVYRLPWKGPSGQAYFVAVDRFGNRLFKATVLERAEADDIVEALWDLLDREDPFPYLQLVS